MPAPGPHSPTILEKLLPGNLVTPAYRGGSILNLPPAIGRLLGVEQGWFAPPLEADGILGGLGPMDRVILLVLDGIGWNRLGRQLGASDDFREWLERGGASMTPITSVSPSTTAVATTCLLGSGAAPAESGMLGYSCRLPKLGVIGNLLFWRPAWNRRAPVGELERWGLVPESFLPTPAIFEVLAQGGVRGSAFMPSHLAASPLSRLQMRGAERVSRFVNFDDCLRQLEVWLEPQAGSRAFAYAYLPDFDTLSHRDGPDGPVWPRLFETVAGQLRRWSAGLAPRLREKTLLLITADHGHVFTPLSRRRLLQDYPEIQALTALREAGEARHMYLYARAGAQEELLELARRRLADDFVVLSGEQALAAGLYGDPGRLHPEAHLRIGDVVLLARGGASMWDQDFDAVLLGMHGALEADEMLVPLVALPLRELP